MSLLGRLHGIATVPITEARVLELGSRDGENLLALAAAWPSAQFTGVEPDATLARAAAERVAATGLTNVDIIRGELDALAAPSADALATYDYIIANGILSRVAPAARDALWTVVAKALAPNGVALVSFDAWPGQHVHEPLRRLMAFHVADIPDDATRAQQARAIARWQVDRWFRVHGPTRHVLLKRQMDDLDAMSDELLLRELLAPEHHPLRLDRFDAEASKHGLQWLTNARANEPRSGRAATQVRELVGAFSDILRQQQYLDFFEDTRFRASLVCHATHDIRRQATIEDFEPLYLAPRADLPDDPEDRPTLSPNAERLLEHVRKTHVAPRPVREVVDEAVRAGLPFDRVAAIVATSELFFADTIELSRTPPRVARAAPAPDERPRGTAWALFQATHGPNATSLWHRDVGLIEIERQALTYCDGSYATDQIVEALGPDATEALEALHRHGFLTEARA